MEAFNVKMKVALESRTNVDISCGSLFRHKGGIYEICSLNKTDYYLINICKGNRWSDSAKTLQEIASQLVYHDFSYIGHIRDLDIELKSR